MAAVTADSTDAFEDARRAMAAGEWEQARVSFAAVLREQEHPEALDGFALASWFHGDVEEGLELRQQAFAAYVGGRGVRPGGARRRLDLAPVPRLGPGLAGERLARARGAGARRA